MADGVVLVDGSRLAACTVVATIGTQANALATAMGLATERGRILVAADLSVVGHTDLWAMGDCAAVMNARDGRIAPPTAQFAVRQGVVLAQNLVCALRGRPTREFGHKALGTMASIGHLKGVAEVFGVSLSGLPAWLLWRAFYLSQMPTIRRKVRIFVEWTWGMFFPTDITHLRFTRSHELVQADPVCAGEHGHGHSNDRNQPGKLAAAPAAELAHAGATSKIL